MVLALLGAGCSDASNAKRVMEQPGCEEIANDCGDLECGLSPSNCHQCGECPAAGDDMPCAVSQCSEAGRCELVPNAAMAGEICGESEDPCLELRCTGMICEAQPVDDRRQVPCEDDGNGCTEDRCIAGECAHLAVANQTACADDGEPCTRDVCRAGECTHPAIPLAEAVPCEDDGEPCTQDICAEGFCAHIDVPDSPAQPCEDDGDTCTSDLCVGGRCEHPPLINDCGSRMCGASPSGCYDCGECPEAAADDCRKLTCDILGQCVAEPDPARDGVSCKDDGVACTTDLCTDGFCDHALIPDDCGARVCGDSPTGCHDCGECAESTDPCSVVNCDNGVCVGSWIPEMDGESCSDQGDACVSFICIEGACTEVRPPNDCGDRECGSSPNGCYECGQCDRGLECDDGVCEVPVGFSLVEPGSYLRGSPPSERGHRANEAPLHQVTLTRRFLISDTEVTQDQWAEIADGNPAWFQNCGGDCPVESVSFYEVLDWLNLRSQAEGLQPCYQLIGCSGIGGGGCTDLFPDGSCLSSFFCAGAELTSLDCEGYRLPTEAEWEWATRAGTTSALYTGGITVLGLNNSPEVSEIAWYGGNSGVLYEGGFDCSEFGAPEIPAAFCGTHPVAQKTPNGNALYDTIGNVFEYVWDRSASYPTDGVTDPLGPDVGDFRVVRGGSWQTVADACRSAARLDMGVALRRLDTGFRVVRSVIPPAAP